MNRFEEKLPAASSEWVADGIISTEQRDRILRLHPDEGHHGFASALGLVGGTALAAGLCLLIASHWQELSDWTKIIGLVGILVTAYVLGWRFRVAPGHYPNVGDGLLFVACMLFMGGIALVSQIYHLNARPATGVLIWWLGIALIPLLTRSKAAQVAAIAAELIWLGYEFVTPGSLLQLAPDAIRHAGSFEAYLAIFLLLGIGLIANSHGLRDGRWESFNGLHAGLGLGISCIALYTLTFAWSKYGWWEVEPRIAWFPIGVILCVLILNLAFGWMTDRKGLNEFAPGLIPAIVVGIVWLVFGHFSDARWWLGMGACVALFSLNLVMIRVGLARGRSGWVNLGMGFIALNILGRYFVLFGTMLQGGSFLAVTGIVVLAAGWWLERKRRSLLAGMEREVA